MVTKTSIWVIIIAITIAGLLLLIPSQPAIIVMAQPEIPEGWVEIISERTRVGKKYLNMSNPSQESITTGLATIHYESIMDTGIYDSECDFSPQRINNAQLDGWRVIQCGWHYALGQPSGKTTDGWVGFGGRQGSNWIMFRLARVGYLHWPTRNWEDIGGNPTYDRLNLVSGVGQSEYGYGNMVNVSATTTWSNIWTTPNQGALNITWQANGDRLKEEIIINQAAREWLQTNKPPSTPASETWFGFVLQVDWTDIPKVIKDGSEQNINGDWDVTNTPIELWDNLDRLLAFMPISEVIIKNGINETREPLIKRFWLDGDGNHYVLMGIRITELVNMPEGDLIFDPTIDKQLAAGTDDGDWTTTPSFYDNGGTTVYIGASGSGLNAWARFTTIAIGGGATIDVAYMTVQPRSPIGAEVKTNILLEDADNPTYCTTQVDCDSRSLTTAFIVWDDETMVDGVDIDTPSIVSVIQEVVDAGYWDSGDSMIVMVFDDGTAAGQYYRWDTYEGGGGPSNAARLHIEYTLWENSAPTIINKISTDNGEIDTIYSRSFAATDVDSNQTLIWTLVTNASFLSVDSLNRTVYINGTLPSSEGSFYVNVTVGDQGPTNLTDYVNYTLNVVEIPEILTHSEWIQIILIGVMFMFLTALAFAHEHAWPLFFVAGLIGVVYGVWLTGFLIAPLLGLTFIFPAIIVMLYGGFRLKEAF